MDNNDKSKKKHVKILGHDGLIGSNPDNKDIVELIIEDGKLPDICEKVLKYIKDNVDANVKPLVIISGGSFFLDSDEFSNAPVNFQQKLLNKVLESFEEVLNSTKQEVNLRDGVVSFASILPQRRIFNGTENDKFFLCQCYQRINSLIWDFNASSNISTPNIKEIIEYKIIRSKGVKKNNKIKGAEQKKFSQVAFVDNDDYHFKPEIQKKFMNKIEWFFDNKL